MADSPWVIVTGAGASTNLGINKEPLPLMPDWSRKLFDSLNRRGLAAREVGLTPDMSGPDFEAALGRLLAWRRALPTAGLIRSFGSPAVGDVPSAVEEWFRTSEHRAQEAVATIHESLYDLFGQAKISSVSATKAYSSLFRELEITSATPLVYVTTNYDVAGELALEDLGFRPFWGEDVALGSGDRVVHTDGLLEALGSRRTPVLHLHGRVGWYFDDEGRVRALDPHARFDANYGTPALLLPDPRKNYEESAFVADLWRQFRDALQQASHVLVVGHSLHDDELARALRDVPKGRLGVSILGASQNSGLADDDERTVQIYEAVPGAQPVEMTFGYDFVMNRHLAKKFLDGARAAASDDMRAN